MPEPSSVNARRWRCGRVQRLAPASTTRTSLHWTAVGMRKTPGQTLTKKRLGAEISRKTQKEPLKVSANCLELCCSFLLIAVYPLSTPSVSRFQAVWPLYSKCTTVSGGVASLLQVHHGFRRCGLSTPSAPRFQAVWPLYSKCTTVSGGVASLLQVHHGFRRCGLSIPSAPRFQAVWPLYSKCTNFQAVWPLYTKRLTASGGEASLHQVSHGFRRRSFLYSNCTMVSGGRSTSSSSVSSVGMM